MLTPNKPADFENPFHLHLFERDELPSMLERHFDEVWLGGVDAAPHVKADLAARRVKANKVLRLDVLDLRHRIPHPLVRLGLHPAAAVGLQADRPGATPGGATGITADDWFVTEELDDTTLVLFAVVRAAPRALADAGRRPDRAASARASRPWPTFSSSAAPSSSTPTRSPATSWPPGGPAYQPLIDRFGPGILAADGTIDRPALAAVAFADDAARPISTPSRTRPSASP